MLKLDLNSPVPLYQQLQDIIRNAILSRQYKVGEKLPSEHELCRDYGVTRPTVRQALEGLVREGLLMKHRGKGAFVTEPPLPVGLFSVIGTIEAFAQQKQKVETTVVRIERVPTSILAQGNDPIGGWYRLERVRRINGIPTFYENTWIQTTLVPGFDKVDLTNQSLFRTLAEPFKFRVDGGKQRFSAVTAPLHIAEHLEVKHGSPLLHVLRLMHLTPTAHKPGYPAGVRIPNALLVDLYTAQGPFVLEQTIPPLTPSGMPQNPDASLNVTGLSAVSNPAHSAQAAHAAHGASVSFR
jgi:DNA-binding GntR family transcriptional regulator